MNGVERKNRVARVRGLKAACPQATIDVCVCVCMCFWVSPPLLKQAGEARPHRGESTGKAPRSARSPPTVSAGTGRLGAAVTAAVFLFHLAFAPSPSVPVRHVAVVAGGGGYLPDGAGAVGSCCATVRYVVWVVSGKSTPIMFTCVGWGRGVSKRNRDTHNC